MHLLLLSLDSIPLELNMRPLKTWIAICALNFAVAWAFDAATQPEGIYYLDFNGGRVRLRTMFPFGTAADLLVPPFRGGDGVEKAVLETVRADFARWPGIQIEMGESHEHTNDNVVFIGDMLAADNLLGIAEKVDLGDVSQDDKAVVFAANIELERCGSDEVFQVIAKVVSHEIGHLLGFSHTKYRDDIMVQGFFDANQVFRFHQQSYVDRRSIWWACQECAGGGWISDWRSVSGGL